MARNPSGHSPASRAPEIMAFIRFQGQGPHLVGVWNKATLRSLLLPGALLLLLAVVLLQGRVLPLSASAINFYYYAAFGAGVLLAFRFRSSRVLSALVILYLGHRAMEFFSAGTSVVRGPGHTAFEVVAFLLPLNFLLLSFVRERGLGLSSLAPHLGLLFVESVFVAVICRPDETAAPTFLDFTIFGRHWFHWTRIPQIAWLVFVVALGVLTIRFLLFRKPVESGLLWSLATAFVALQAGGIGPAPRAYMATAALVLVGSIIENSYVLAYHDELTSLPARRAFNEALLRLETPPYSAAMLDIDHFKRFNDTYGHETGDQVLRMVAARVAQVSGGGQPFRVGGEEFCILFPGKSADEAAEHLELLRQVIESSTFHTRVTHDRRRTPHGPDRRKTPRKKVLGLRALPHNSGGQELSVTVSIGIAESSPRLQDADRVVRAADKALYLAKQSGRNRVETFAPTRVRVASRSA